MGRLRMRWGWLSSLQVLDTNRYRALVGASLPRDDFVVPTSFLATHRSYTELVPSFAGWLVRSVQDDVQLAPISPIG